MRPPHLTHVLEPLDDFKSITNQMSYSPYDPSNAVHVHNAKVMLLTAMDNFVQTDDAVRDYRLVLQALDALERSVQTHDAATFDTAKAQAHRAVDDLEATLTRTRPSDMARALGIA